MQVPMQMLAPMRSSSSNPCHPRASSLLMPGKPHSYLSRISKFNGVSDHSFEPRVESTIKFDRDIIARSQHCLSSWPHIYLLHHLTSWQPVGEMMQLMCMQCLHLSC